MARFKDRERGAVFFTKALEAAYENGAEKLPSQVAAFALLREIHGARKEWNKLLALTDQALAATLGDDEKLYAAQLAGVVAWKELGDKDKARVYFDRVRQIEPAHPSLRRLRRPGGPATLRASTRPVMAAASPMMVPPPAANPAPPPAAPAPARGRPRIEVIGDAQNVPHGGGPRRRGAAARTRAIDGWKKAVAADPSQARAAPRAGARPAQGRALERARRGAQGRGGRRRAKSPDEKVRRAAGAGRGLPRPAEARRAIAGTLAQILQQQPDNQAVIDQLAAQYEQMKRWPDLVSTLGKKASGSRSAEKVALYLRIANLYLEKFSNQAEAIKAFESALELDPTTLEAPPT
jgi:tetratricopeptide (TPR) repeat protein